MLFRSWDAGAGRCAPKAGKRLRRQTPPSRPLACAHPRQVADRNAAPRGRPALRHPPGQMARNPCPDSVPFIEKLDAPFDFRAAFMIAICDLRESNPIRCNSLLGEGA